MYVEQTAYMQAEEIMQDASERKAGTVFFVVNSVADINKIMQAYPFYDYDSQPFTMKYKGKDIVCYLTKAVYSIR